MRLRRRLSVLVAIALVPSLLLTAYNAARWRIFLENEARATALSEARATSSELDQIIGNARQLLTTMTKFPLNTDNKDECALHLKSIISGVQTFHEAAIIDMDGRFLCSTTPEPLDVGDRLYFSPSSKVSDLVAGTIIQGGVTHSTSIHLSMPYRDADGSIKGEIVLIGDLERLGEGLQAYQWRPDHRLIILDDQGSLVFTLPTNDSEEADTIAKLISPQILNAKTGAVVVKDSIGRNSIVGVAAPGSASENLFTAVALD